MKRSRSGEKAGWSLGWLGGFVWVVILSIIFLVQGKVATGVIGLGLVAIAVGAIVACAPWRHPDTPYWKLLLPVYLVFAASVAWGVRTAGGWESFGLRPTSVFVVLPILLPFALAGRRRWSDGVERE